MPNFTVRTIFAAILAASVIAPVRADWAPTHKVEFVIPFGPGGGADILARTLIRAIEVDKLVPVPILPANRGGRNRGRRQVMSKRIAKAADLPAGFALHSLPHEIGSVLVDAGMTAMQVATALGQASSKTSERYRHAVDGARAILAQRAAELVRPLRLRAVASPSRKPASPASRSAG